MRCGITQPAVSRHLRVLREGGFVRAQVAGQQRIYHLHPDGFRQLAGWLDHYRTFWEDRLDRLEALVQQLERDVDGCPPLADEAGPAAYRAAVADYAHRIAQALARERGREAAV